MKMKRLAGLILSVLVVSGILSGCNRDASISTVEAIKKRGVVKIGIFGDKPPFGFVDANGENQGFDVYIARRFAKDLLGDEAKIEFVLLEPASRVEYLQTNKVDIVLANFTVTEERKEKVDFANPYMKVAIGVVSPNDVPITSVEQLKDQKLIIIKGTTAETYFANNHPEVEQLKFEQITQAFEALKDKRGAALSQDNTLLLAWATENTGFTVGIPTLGSLDTIAPAVKKGNADLLDWINRELERLGEENFIHQAYDATLKPVYGDSVPPEEIVIEGGKL